MDPLTLLRELYGEEPIQKIVISGFDSADKIALAAPESLSFFAGVNEALARQIIATAVESLGAAAPGHRGALAESPSGEHAPAPVRPRVAVRPPAPTRSGQRRERGKSDPMDEKPLLDAGGLLKTLAEGVRAKEVMEEDVLEQIGLTDAEAHFLEGPSPWSTEPTLMDPALEPGEPAPRIPEVSLEMAPISDWSPESDPDPVPRIVRAPELGPEPEAGLKEEQPAEEPRAVREVLSGTALSPAAEKMQALEPPPFRPSFWRFGK